MSISTDAHSCKRMKGLFALSPLLVFVAIYLISSIVAGDFYKVPISVAFMLASIYAIAISRGPMQQRVETFSKGAGKPGIMLMLWVFVLAGAFAASAKDIGCIDSTVALMLRIVPERFILPGIFLTTCFVSMAIGTSVGCIVALVPIAAGLATATGSSLPLFVGVVVGGAFFGDNLSFISDTTIAATTSQNCRMADKFRANVWLAFPAAIVVLATYAFMGQDMNTPPTPPTVDTIKIIPYLAVLVAALAGLNVMSVLTLGLVLTGVIGVAKDSTDLYGWMGSMGNGIMGMGELIIITMLAGGLFEMVRVAGGVSYIISKTTTHIHGKRGAETVMGSLVAMVDVCTANNTVAIITVSGIAKQLSEKFGIDPRRTASLLDTFSCIAQGIIPYGAQMLMASGLAKLSPIEIMPYLYYPYALAAVTVASIVLRFPKRYTR